MDDEYPVDDGIHVLKEGRKLGPFTVEDLFDGLESGDFSEDDICLRPGATECERLRELLDWEDGEELDRDAEDEDDFEEETSERFPPSSGTAATPRIQATSKPDRLLYAGHPSVLTYPVSLLSLVVGATGAVWLYPLNPNFTLAGLALALAGLVRLSLVRFTHDYQIRPRRLEVITGLMARSSREVRIEDIRSINVSCRGLSGMVGIGTVDFLTSGDTPEVSFEKVWAAKEIKSLVRRLQDSA